MKKSFFLSFLVIPFFAQTLISQTGGSSVRDISKGLRAYRTIWSPEKIFINTDKVHYAPGETIWASVYLVDGITHKKSPNSNVVYLEVVDGNGNVISKKRGFAEDLGCSMSFHVHENTPDGAYTIRGYTKYMQNDLKPFDYEREIYIGDVDVPIYLANDLGKGEYVDKGNDVELSFYPEGGQLVYGILGELVVKSLDAAGRPVGVKGEIVNNLGNVVTTFDTGVYGLAKCTFTPVDGNTYSARFQDGIDIWEQNLPDILEKGYSLSMENMGEHIIIQAETTAPTGLDGTTLVGHMRGDRFLWFRGDKVHGSKFSVRVPSDELQDGIAHFTLFTEEGEPVSERLAYIQSQVNRTKLSFSTAKQGLDGELSLNFELTDGKGIPAKGIFSVSILEAGVERDTALPYENIENWLEFHSDYGKSLQAYDVLKEKDVTRRRNILDALMVTGDWKRFSWEDMAKERPIERYLPPEKGIFVSGTTESLGKNRKAVPSMVTLELMGGELYRAKKQTNTEGRFVFGPFDFKDSIPMVLKASRLSGRNEEAKQKVVIVLDEETDFNLAKTDDELSEEKNVADRKADRNQKKVRVAQIEPTTPREAYDFETGKKITQLNEVVITEKKKSQEKVIAEQLKEITLYNTPTNRVFLDSLPQTGIRNIMYVLRTLPGVQVRGPEGGEFVTIRYGTFSVNSGIGPLFLIDGVPTSIDAVRTLSALDIMFIDVLEGANAAIYGTRGANGVIAIYTHRGSGLNYAGSGATIGADGRRSPHILTLIKKGYDTSDSFEGEECSSPILGKMPPSYGETVLWEPNVDIFGKRHKTLTFCPDDLAGGNYLIRVEGISEDGNAISEEFVLPKAEF
nr:TonB-dependent receptor plug domain-containing protein [uncultured Allomuricauda sp.]